MKISEIKRWRLNIRNIITKKICNKENYMIASRISIPHKNHNIILHRKTIKKKKERDIVGFIFKIITWKIIHTTLDPNSIRHKKRH